MAEELAQIPRPDLDQDELELERSEYLQHKVQALRGIYVYCIVCGSPRDLEAHHIIYRSQRGGHELTNLALLCRCCHDAAHGIPSKDHPPFYMRRNEDGVLITIDRATGEITERDESRHIPSERQAEIAHTLHQEIQRVATLFHATGLELGEKLRLMDQSKGFRALGYGTFNEYLAGSGLPIGRARAYALMAINGQCQRLHLDPSSLLDIDKDKLNIVLPRATEDTVDDLLNDARTLSRSDLRAKITGEEREFNYEATHSHICQKCGFENTYPGEGI